MPSGGKEPLATCFEFSPRGLVPRSGREYLASLLAPVPDHLIHTFGFELRLREQDSRVDLFLGYDRDKASILAETAAALARLDECSSSARAWHRLGEFARRWPYDSAFAGTDHLWVEYRAEGNHWSLPGVFLARGAPSDSPGEVQSWAETCFDVVGEISGHHIGEPIRAECRRCLVERPRQAVPASVAFFLGQPHPGLRLCIVGLDLHSLAEFLHRVEWDGNIERVKELLADLITAPGILGSSIGLVHLDVTNTLQPRIGVELVFEFRQQLKLGRLTSPLLRRLVTLGLCTERKASALEAWPGAFFAPLEDCRSRQLFIRRVNHVKLVFDCVGHVEAKAYFGARMHLPRHLKAGNWCEVLKESYAMADAR